MFTYGEAGRCEAALGDCTRLSAAEALHPPLADPADAIRRALERPQGFPPLSAATVPGDRVAIALGAGVPDLESVLAGVLAALMKAGVEPNLVRIVSETAIASRERLEQHLQTLGAAGVQFERHDPEDENEIAMIGVSATGLPLRINRTLAEADFVLPIGSGQGDDAADGAKFTGLYPKFSDQDAIVRLRPDARDSAKQRDQRVAEIDEAGWKLGVGLVLSVVPAAGGGVAAVAAGDPGTVVAAAVQQASEVWQRPALQPVELVVAALSGDRREQTWENFARALEAAEPVLLEGGALVVFTELEEPPSGPMEQLFDAVDFDEVQRELVEGGAADIGPALALARALNRGPVYLRSRLPAETVESLGMTPIESDAELSRLAASRGHCLLIEEAQRVVPTLIDRDSS